MQLDLSAIAKGYAVDQVAALLQDRGVPGFLVEVGGETRVQGTKQNGRLWTLGIEAPRDGIRSIGKVLHLANASLATSGDYRNFFKENGKRYSHMIDPRTGRPIEHNLTSVSVVDVSCTRADALATALAVLGPDEGYRYAVEQRLAALFVLRDGSQFLERVTPGFAELDSGRNEGQGSAFVLCIAAATLAFTAFMVIFGLRRNRTSSPSCHTHQQGHPSTDQSGCQNCGIPSSPCSLETEPRTS
jgi:hypothetical protein